MSGLGDYSQAQELCMPVFDKKDFPKVLTQVEQGIVAPLYFLHGEDYLVKSALAQLTEILVPESQQSTNLEIVDGNQADFRQILDNVNTFALFGGRKVVVVQDCRVFYSRANLPALYVKSKEAHEAGDLNTALLSKVFKWLRPQAPRPSRCMLIQGERATAEETHDAWKKHCLLYTSPSPRDVEESRMPSSA